MSGTRVWVWAIVSAATWALTVMSALAQEYRATVLGQVTDPTSSAIPNVTVKATKEGANVSRETVTNTEGIYTLVGLEPGRYTVTVTAQGFTSVRREGIVLQVAEKLNLPVTMEVGQVAESITVGIAVERDAELCPLVVDGAVAVVVDRVAGLG